MDAVKRLRAWGNPAAMGGFSGIIVDDSFNTADGTFLTGSVPDVGSAWRTTTGGYTMSGGRARASEGATNISFQETFLHDVTITFNFQAGQANGNYAPSIVLAMTTPDDYLWVYFSGDGNLQLYKRIAGAATLLQTTTWAADASAHDGEIVLAGNQIRVSVDGVLKATWTASFQLTGTGHGLLGFGSGGHFDSFGSFRVTAPAPYAPPTWPGAFGTSLFAPSFVQANGTRLNTLGFTEPVGAWTTQGNKAEVAAAAGPVTGYVAVEDAATADVALEAQVTIPAVGAIVAGFTLRFADTDTNGFIELELNTRPTYYPDKGFGMWRYDPGTGLFIEIMTRHTTIVAGATYTMRLRSQGHILIAEVPELGLQMWESDWHLLTRTKHGLFVSQDAGAPGPALFDQFVIRGL